MTSGCASIHRRGPYSSEVVTAAAEELRQALGRPGNLAFAFVTPDYLPHLEEFCETIRVDGHISELVGATGLGIIADGVEEEQGSGFCVLALSASGAGFQVIELHQNLVDQADSADFWRKRVGGPLPHGWLVLTNAFAFDVEGWLEFWNPAFPGVPCIGGLSSGSEKPEENAVFHNGRTVEGVAVGVSGALRIFPVVSQGCRPIGEPLTVTRAENNVVYSLGSHPAYQALESAFEGLTDREKAGAKGNLFAGLAGTEYVDDFQSGHFLIRNILGADPDSGAVVIGGIPRVGQTLQYQLRDRATADADLRAILSQASREAGAAPLASLLFSCAGRGSQLFGNDSHDAGAMTEILGPHPNAGFFCNGEIGPLGGKNCIHTYTAAGALFFKEDQEP